jgi:hypothetical protein
MIYMNYVHKAILYHCMPIAKPQDREQIRELKLLGCIYIYTKFLKINDIIGTGVRQRIF